MSVYVIGDTHGVLEYTKILTTQQAVERHLDRELTLNDYIIVCGDFGLPLVSPDYLLNKLPHLYKKLMVAVTDLEENLHCTLLWVDGNHENFDFWKKIKVTTKWGGKVQKHPFLSNCYHLMRGEFYTICDRVFFTLGGALSVDFAYRVPGLEWWPEEIITDTEKEYVLRNIKKHKNCDFVITHTLPSFIISELNTDNQFCDMLKVSDDTARFLNVVYQKLSFKNWYAGHFHTDGEFKYGTDHMFYVLYNRFVEIPVCF